MLSNFTKGKLGGTSQDPNNYLEEDWEYVQQQPYELDEDEVDHK